MPKIYNYARYKPSHYDLGAFAGPRAGETAPDFAFKTMAGDLVKLSDYRGRWLVLETGSYTCPMFVRNIAPMQKLSHEFADVEFLVVYVREAHPGARTGPHETFDDKVDLAQRQKASTPDARDFLIDSVDGDAHRAMGAFPNLVYVVDPDGRVVYRCNWSYPNRVREVLAERGRLHTLEHAMTLGAAPWIMLPVTLRGGWDAFWDLAIVVPGMAWAHLKVDIAHLVRRARERRSLSH